MLVANRPFKNFDDKVTWTKSFKLKIVDTMFITNTDKHKKFTRACTNLPSTSNMWNLFMWKQTTTRKKICEKSATPSKTRVWKIKLSSKFSLKSDWVTLTLTYFSAMSIPEWVKVTQIESKNTNTTKVKRRVCSFAFNGTVSGISSFFFFLFFFS